MILTNLFAKSTPGMVELPNCKPSIGKEDCCSLCMHEFARLGRLACEKYDRIVSPNWICDDFEFQDI